MQQFVQELEEPVRHKCLIYDGDSSEQLPVVVPLLVDGLRENWRCLYLGSPDAVRMVGSALGANGVDLERETGRGALVLSTDRSHLVGGLFDPATMIDGLRAGIDGAVRDGYTGLCATGDMRWELGDDRNFDRLVEYEARLEQVFREMPLKGICQYHRDLVPARAIADALMTHRSTYLGERLNRDNLYYVPPELLLDADAEARARHGEWMYQQIARVLDAERARDRALAVLRESEAEQRRLAEELAELNRGLEQRVADRTTELSVANRQLEAFSYSVAHDLRAPLRAIRSFTSMVAADAGDRLDPQSGSYLQRVIGAAARMSDLIEGLLDLSRISRVDLMRMPVDLTKLAHATVDTLRTNETGREVEVTIEGGLRASGDPRLVRALLDNLLGNAWKFTGTRRPGRIEVGAREARDGREFFVKDNGVGFDPAYADNLFAPFKRLHGTEFPGTGIGLATVHRIIERHGGTIRAESVRGQGATFSFTLPD